MATPTISGLAQAEALYSLRDRILNASSEAILVNKFRSLLALPSLFWRGMPLASTAALAVLDTLEHPGVYPTLLRQGERSRNQVQQVISRSGVPMGVIGIGPVPEIVFTDEPVVSPRQSLPKVEPEVIKAM